MNQRRQSRGLSQAFRQGFFDQDRPASLEHLPGRLETDPQCVAERYREKEVVKRRLANLYNESARVLACLDATVDVFNGTAGDPRSFDLLDQLLERQIYRPAFCLMAQGTKRVVLNDESYVYDADNYLVLSAPMPMECATRAACRK